jgi:hypothetical protein
VNRSLMRTTISSRLHSAPSTLRRVGTYPSRWQDQWPSWAGCGAHIEQVFGHVPKAESCQGHPRTTKQQAKLPT